MTQVSDGGPYEPGTAVVGVVGLGAMGAGIASSILRGGFETVVADLRADAVAKAVAEGATAATDLADLAATCDAIVVMVLDDKQVLGVTEQIAVAGGRVRAVIVSSTVTPQTAQAAAARLEQAGIAMIDAPVSGGAEKSALGTLTLLIGGPDDVVAQCAPIIDAMSANVFHVGPVGAGSAGKLVNNLMALGQYALQVEAMQLADAYGITEETAVAFVTVSAGDSAGIRTWGRYDRLRRTHTIAGTPELYTMLGKDLRGAALAAGRVGVTLPVTAIVGELIAGKLQARDAMLDARGGLGPEVLCPGCGQELAAPFREAGYHPQCGLAAKVAEHGL